jgi:ferredoxin
MIARTLRKIVKIDEEKCNGCGACVPACVEGALQIIGGKARLVSEEYCDGLGACLGECPQGAISIDEREAMEFDEEATKHHVKQEERVTDKLPCGCPSTTVRQFERGNRAGAAPGGAVRHQSMLHHWPVQLALVPQSAPFLQGADIVLAADCVPFAYADFHHDFLKDHALLVACPKLDDFQAHQRKLTDILSHSDIRSLTVLHMEVPCCSGLANIAKHAIRLSGKKIPFKEQTIGIGGDIKS